VIEIDADFVAGMELPFWLFWLAGHGEDSTPNQWMKRHRVDESAELSAFQVVLPRPILHAMRLVKVSSLLSPHCSPLIFSRRGKHKK
jgi:hypothetical protein